MKNWFIIVLIFSYYAGSSQGIENAAKHVGAGMVIGGVGGYAAQKIFHGQRGWRWAGAVGSSLAAGLVKESRDKAVAGLWQTDDVLYATLGGVISGAILELIYKNEVSNRRGGRRKGKHCGCLLAHTSTSYNLQSVYLSTKGSGNIGSTIYASYFLEKGL